MDEPCGCYVEAEDGYGDDGRGIRCGIVYCPTHKTAPEMRQLVNKLAYEPVGPPEASAREILGVLTGEARALLARLDGKE